MLLLLQPQLLGKAHLPAVIYTTATVTTRLGALRAAHATATAATATATLASTVATAPLGRGGADGAVAVAAAVPAAAALTVAVARAAATAVPPAGSCRLIKQQHGMAGVGRRAGAVAAAPVAIDGPPQPLPPFTRRCSTVTVVADIILACHEGRRAAAPRPTPLMTGRAAPAPPPAATAVPVSAIAAVWVCRAGGAAAVLPAAGWAGSFGNRGQHAA